MTETQVATTIRDGVASTAMPSFSGVFGAAFDRDQQYADLARFLKTALPRYDVNAGNAADGQASYTARTCVACHGIDGRAIDFHHGEPPPEFLGAAKHEAEEFAHRIQFGHPRPDAQQVDIWGLAMPAFGRTSNIDTDEIADLIAHLKTLPDS